MSDPNKPNDCCSYDELESLAVHRTVCEIVFINDLDTVECATSRIVDVYSRDRKEFIEIVNGRVIRLDRLRQVNGKSIHGSCDIE